MFSNLFESINFLLMCKFFFFFIRYIMYLCNFIELFEFLKMIKIDFLID